MCHIQNLKFPGIPHVAKLNLFADDWWQHVKYLWIWIEISLNSGVNLIHLVSMSCELCFISSFSGSNFLANAKYIFAFVWFSFLSAIIPLEEIELRTLGQILMNELGWMIVSCRSNLSVP